MGLSLPFSLKIWTIINKGFYQFIKDEGPCNNPIGHKGVFCGGSKIVINFFNHFYSLGVIKFMSLPLRILCSRIKTLEHGFSRALQIRFYFFLCFLFLPNNHLQTLNIIKLSSYKYLSLENFLKVSCFFSNFLSC